MQFFKLLLTTSANTIHSVLSSYTLHMVSRHHKHHTQCSVIKQSVSSTRHWLHFTLPTIPATAVQTHVGPPPILKYSSSFYSASALLAMQSAVLSRAILCVRHSVTFECIVQTKEDTIVRFSASGRIIPLVSGQVNFIRIFVWDHPQRGR